MLVWSHNKILRVPITDRWLQYIILLCCISDENCACAITVAWVPVVVDNPVIVAEYLIIILYTAETQRTEKTTYYNFSFFFQDVRLDKIYNWVL